MIATKHSAATNHSPTLSLSPSLPVRGLVFDIQRCSLHDGPGIRTTVFLKGCPLRCEWCHNPESQKSEPETGLGGKVYGTERSVEEIMEIVRADRAYYASSGGGLTVSGGEPTVQFDFCRALLTAAKVEGIHTCLDTCGHVSPEKLLALLPLVDLWHYDYKATGSEMHRRFTGLDNTLILKNLAVLRENNARIRLRCPVIPGGNDTEEHLRSLDAFEASGDFASVERLPYHTTGNAKYSDLGRPVPEFKAA